MSVEEQSGCKEHKHKKRQREKEGMRRNERRRELDKAKESESERKRQQVHRQKSLAHLHLPLPTPAHQCSGLTIQNSSHSLHNGRKQNGGWVPETLTQFLLGLNHPRGVRSQI